MSTRTFSDLTIDLHTMATDLREAQGLIQQTFMELSGYMDTALIKRHWAAYGLISEAAIRLEEMSGHQQRKEMI